MNVVNQLIDISPTRNGGLAPSARDFATALGWAGDNVFTTPARSILDGVEVSSGCIRHQTGIVVASPSNPRDLSWGDVETVSNFGYHTTARWGVAFDAKKIRIFSTHWLNQGRTYSLPDIEWDSVEARRSDLELLSPQDVVNAKLDSIAPIDYGAPTTLMKSIDDEIVSRLDRWRSIAISNAPLKIGVDAQLQTLFAQLFVLRTIEDKNLTGQIPSLITAIPHGKINYDQLACIFQAAKTIVGSELFDIVDFSQIPVHVLEGVIRDLYYLRPTDSIKLNFSWLGSDVLGATYEKYLSSILSVREHNPQLSLFSKDEALVERITVRQAGGVYYTPSYLTNRLVSKAMDECALSHDNIPRVIDIACGSGSFLVAALNELVSRLIDIDSSRNWAREIVDNKLICGVDIDPKAVVIARLNIWSRLTDEADPLPLPRLSECIVSGDGLDPSTWGELPETYDLVVGNPPFLTSQRVKNREALASRFVTARGRYDYSSLFMEMALNLTTPKGVIALVVPNRLLRNENTSPVRALLASRMQVVEVMDFGSLPVFSGVDAYISCVVATHRPGDMPPNPIQVSLVSSLPNTEMGLATFLFDSSSKDVVRYMSAHPLGGEPWLLLSDTQKRRQAALKDDSVELSELASVFQGIKTGANDIFVVESDINLTETETVSKIVNGFGDAALIETAVLRRVVFGSDLRRYGPLPSGKFIIHLYVNNVPIEEPLLADRYPLTYSYLKRYRDILEGRSSLSSSNLLWYELVRKRDNSWLSAPKLMMRDLAVSTSFSADLSGSYSLIGGTAVVPQDETLLLPILGYLNSRPVSELISRSAPEFKGGFKKIEPRHLNGVPVPNTLMNDEAALEELGALALSALTTGAEDFDSNIDSLVSSFTS